MTTDINEFGFYYKAEYTTPLTFSYYLHNFYFNNSCMFIYLKNNNLRGFKSAL